MATDLDNKAPIQPEGHEAIRLEDHETMLRNLQGNILKGHGRDHSVHIFLKFNKPASEVYAHLAKLVDDHVITSAWEQHQQGKAKREKPNEMFGNLFLTAAGYSQLDLNPSKLPHATKYFLDGMRGQHSLDALQDPKPETWEPVYQNRIDAMILLANMQVTLLNKKEEEIRKELNEFADILVTEHGTVQRKANQKVEHFGFIDAMSEPMFFSADLPKKKKNWNPFASPSLVLVPDSLAQEKDCYGSYLVYRKLDQNVRQFIIGTPRLAQELTDKSGTQVNAQRVEAMMIGRFAHQGTPLTLSDLDDKPLENDFTYAGDTGLKCPVFAHIRATNPRTDKSKRIARRSIPYGRRASMDDLPQGPAGLLFLCFQSNIDDQFAHIQREANRHHDPLIRHPSDALPAGGEWPIEGGRGTISHGFNPTWVTLKGGEFFFAPSIPFLKNPRKP
jgi:Dyp-type peroxidase family